MTKTGRVSSVSPSGPSANELEYQLLLCRDLGYLKDPSYREILSQCQEIRRMLTSFRRSLDTPSN